MLMLSFVASVGENVKRIRLEAGYRHQGRFAQRAGVSQQWLSDLENGRYDMPDTPSLLKLAKALDCSVDDLLSGVDPQYDAASEARHRNAVAVYGDEEIDLGDGAQQAEALKILQQARDEKEHARIVRALALKRISDADRQHLERWHRLAEKQRGFLETIITELLPQDAAANKPAKRKKTA